jgi:two-component system chemotaxis response regulator CheB
MAKRRILIVDESVVVRRSLTHALSREPTLTVVGSAASARIALMKMPLLRPDVVLLDISLPGMDALETLMVIHQNYPETLVIVLNAETERAAAATVDARAMGARNFVMKPEPAARPLTWLQTLSAAIVSRIGAHPPARTAVGVPPVATPTRIAVAHRVDVVAIGVSTGGPSALMELLPRLAADFPVPIVIVQHMPPTFTKLLADRLASKCRVRVAEVGSREILKPGDVWIAPGDFHLSVERSGTAVVTRVHQDARENSCRPSVDVLFRSVAQTWGPHTLAVVMTGMGRDGVAGCREIRAAGGQILVQDQASAVVWGMPGLVVEAGLADQIVPLSGLAEAITNRVSQHRSTTGDLVGR